ncbi:MAG: hypothetical protein K2N39_06490 [Lachnospiraceae bacterium]|nr:hypothetical protein [Lachnospiraceae bacterium]MDE7359061.1 hypothetical protein [Lachnospiraceae bacterium]
MRMTNKIMRNNSAYNINQNKILQDKLTNQMTTQSKIARPSDDPVVAIRALRLRSNVTTVTQYNDKNAADADQWLTLTADAMKTVDDVLTDLYRQATTSADKYETSDDLRILLTQMKQLTAEFYSCANVDYAGRYVFSGYRTDLPVTFTKEDMKEMKDHPVSYNIDESFGFQDISRISYTDYGKLRENLTGNPNGPTTAPGIDAENSYVQNVTNSTLYRFRLSYNNVDSLGTADMEGNAPKLTFTMPDGTVVEAAAPAIPSTGSFALNTTVTAGTGTAPQIVEFADQEEAYKAIADGSFNGQPFTGIAYIPSSGEMVFSKDFYEANFNEAAFNTSSSGFQVNYNKSSWKEGDINPVHYFKCIETKNTASPNDAPDLRKTAYNTQRDQGRNQDIYYDVGYNQQIQVNTRADEIFTHDVQRDMDDFEHYLNQLENIETLLTDLETKLKDYAEGSAQYKDISLRIEGAKKAQTYIRENVHTKFENQITKYQKYQDDSRVAMTDNATRGSRLELISTRLTNQKATFKELQQDNEGIDITEVAVELTASELTYNAALMATGKIMQTNLMNFI